MLDASDVELYVYDRDALNDFIGYAKLDLEEELQDEESAEIEPKENVEFVETSGLASEKFSPTKQTTKSTTKVSKATRTTKILTSKDKKPIPPRLATKIRYDKHTGRKYAKTIHLSSLPGKPTAFVFRRESFKEKLMFWEGERKFTGTITCEYWFGSKPRRGISSERRLQKLKPRVDGFHSTLLRSSDCVITSRRSRWTKYHQLGLP